MFAGNFSLINKRVLITGASSGIGRQTAILCSEMGCTVILVGRDRGRLEETRLALSGSDHIIVVADLMDPVQYEGLVETSGMVDGVVHAAGVSRLIPFRMITKKHLDDIFNVNTFAPILISKLYIARKKISNGGSIVFISALASHGGPMASGAYASSKAALIGAMRVLGREISKIRVRVNLISPGYVETPMLEMLNNSGAKISSISGTAPLGIGQPEDIAYSVVYLLSDASRGVNRSNIIVDGGLAATSDMFA